MNAKYLMLQDALKKATSVIVFILLARFLAPSEFGKVQQLILIPGILAIICSAGVPAAIGFFGGKGSRLDEKKAVISRLFVVQLMSVTLGVAVLASTSSLLSEELSNEYIVDALPVLICILIGGVFLEFYRHVAVVLDRLKSFFIGIAISQAVLLAGFFILLFKHSAPDQIIICLGISGVVIFVSQSFMNFDAVKLARSSLRFKANEIKYSLSMAGVALVGLSNTTIDQVVVSWVLGAEDFADLKIGGFQIPVIGIVTGSFLALMIPKVASFYSSGSVDDIRALWRSSIEKSTFLLVPIIAFCITCSSEIICNVFGQQYESAEILFQVYMFQWLRAVVIFGGVLGAVGMQGALLRNSILIGVCNLLLTYIFIKAIGVLGAAVSTVILNYFGGFLLHRKIQKKVGFRFIEYFPLNMYLWVMFLSLGLSLVSRFCLNHTSGGLVSLLCISITYYAVITFVLHLIYFGPINRHSLKRLMSIDVP